MKKLLFPFVLLLFAVAMQAQIQDPVKFNSELKIFAADEAEVFFTAAIDKGWHVYSTDLGDGGPISATFNVEKIFGAEVVGKLKPVGKEISTFDKLFEMKVRYFENTAQFVQKLKLTGGAYQLEGYLEYGACNDENCLPPTQVPFQFSGKVEGAAKEAAAATAEMKAETQSAEQETAADTVSVAAIGGADGPTEINVTDKVDLWKPVINELQSLGETCTSRNQIMGPVQEKDTSDKVNAIRKMLSKPLVASALLSTAVLHLEGNVISNAPKKEAANTTSIRQKRILNTAFVESAFSALAPKISVMASPSVT